MRLIERYLDAVTRALTARTGGKDAKRSPRVVGGQKSTELSHSEIMSLPEDMLGPIQDMDPDSETFGEFYFMLGYDDLGGTAPLGGYRSVPVAASVTDTVDDYLDVFDRLDVFGVVEVE